jgi:hypothetical protein
MAWLLAYLLNAEIWLAAKNSDGARERDERERREEFILNRSYEHL